MMGKGGGHAALLLVRLAVILRKKLLARLLHKQSHRMGNAIRLDAIVYLGEKAHKGKAALLHRLIHYPREYMPQEVIALIQGHIAPGSCREQPIERCGRFLQHVQRPSLLLISSIL